jgi:hypothetical protein
MSYSAPRVYKPTSVSVISLYERTDQLRTWTKQEGEIVSLAHFVLYPAILALKIWRGFCFVIGMALLLIVWQAYEHAGWIVGIGPNSREYRQQFVTRATDYPEDVEMDFSAHPVMSEERKALFAQYPGSSSNPSLIEPVFDLTKSPAEAKMSQIVDAKNCSPAL